MSLSIAIDFFLHEPNHKRLYYSATKWLGEINITRKLRFKNQNPKPIVLCTIITLIPLVGYFISPVLWVYNPFLPPLDSKARGMAGLGAVDCGSVKTYDFYEPKASAQLRSRDACMVEAFKSGKSFIARETSEGLPAERDTFTVGKGDSRIYEIYDQYDLLNQANEKREVVYQFSHASVTNDP